MRQRHFVTLRYLALVALVGVLVGASLNLTAVPVRAYQGNLLQNPGLIRRRQTSTPEAYKV